MTVEKLLIKAKNNKDRFIGIYDVLMLLRKNPVASINIPKELIEYRKSL